MTSPDPMNPMTRRQRVVAAIAMAVLVLIIFILGCFAFGGAAWLLGEAVDQNIEAHSVGAFPEYTQGEAP